jgi:hypothetical protein
VRGTLSQVAVSTEAQRRGNTKDHLCDISIGRQNDKLMKHTGPADDGERFAEDTVHGYDPWPDGLLEYVQLQEDPA